MTTSLDPRRTVFVDVDTQIDFVEPDGALYVPTAETLKPRLRALLDAARRAGASIVASADAHPPDDPEFAIFPPHCVAGTQGALRIAETLPEGPVTRVDLDGRSDGVSDGAAAPGGTVVLEKVAFDLFTNPAADRVLRDTGADTAVVFGVALDYCVRAAALGLAERGYRTLLVTDATAPVTAEGGAKALAELSAAGVEPVSTDAVLRALDARN